MTNPDIKIRTFLDKEELKADISFTENNLDEAMIQQAGLSAYYGEKAAKAQQQASLLKVNLKAVEARAFAEIRSSHIAAKEKYTDSLLKAEVASDPRVVHAEKALAAAMYQADVGRTAVEAFRQRRDMIVQVAKGRHEELRGELRTVAKEETRLGMEDLKNNALKIAGGKA